MFEEVEDYLQTLNEQQLNEVFNQFISDVQVSNMKPSSKIPSLWKVYAPGNDNMCIWLSNYQSKKDSFKQIKPGDKFAQLWFLSVSDKGNAEIFKGGLGTKPIAVLNAVFDTVLGTVMDNNMDGILMRFPIKKMKGKITQLAKISKRIVQQRTHGVYDFLDEMVEHQTGRYAFMLFYRKSKGITGIKDIGLNPDVFKTETSKTGIGEVVVNIKTGEELTKAEAIAQSIAMTASKQTEKQAAQKVPRISKAEVIAAFSGIVVQPGKKDQASAFNSNRKPDTVAAAEIDSDKLALKDTDIELMMDHINDPKLKEILRKTTEKHNNTLPADPKTLCSIISEYKKAGASDRQIKEEIYHVVTTMNDRAMAVYQILYNDKIVEHEYTPVQQHAIKTYCGQGYEDINFVFTRNRKPDEMTITHINSLDDAFADGGIMMKPGTTLYRGMHVKSSIYSVAIQNKAFFFRNYVSTSLRPLIFSGATWGSVEMLPLNTKLSSPEDVAAQHVPSQADNNHRLGFIIDPADTPCLIPGSLTPFLSECEVIMPRGTIFKFKSVAEHDEKRMTLIQCDAMHHEQLAEGEIVYDGDALINEGVVKPLSFASFVISEQESKNSHDLSTADLDILLSIVDMDGLSDKFMDVGLSE